MPDNQKPLAELLLRRKELRERLDRMQQINQRELFEVKARRKSVSENIDDIVAEVPKMSYAEFSAEYNALASQHRRLDALIQQANWSTQVDAPFELFKDPEIKTNSDKS